MSNEPLKKSVPTVDLQAYYECGWAYVMPDFDKRDHSKIEWLSDGPPVYPHRVQPDTNQGSADGNDRRQQPA